MDHGTAEKMEALGPTDLKAAELDLHPSRLHPLSGLASARPGLRAARMFRAQETSGAGGTYPTPELGTFPYYLIKHHALIITSIQREGLPCERPDAYKSPF